MTEYDAGDRNEPGINREVTEVKAYAQERRNIIIGATMPQPK